MVNALMHDRSIRLQAGRMEQGLAGRAHRAPLLSRSPEDVGLKLMAIVLSHCGHKFGVFSADETLKSELAKDLLDVCGRDFDVT